MHALLSAIYILYLRLIFFFFFFNDTATTEIYTLSLHDALPIYGDARIGGTRRDVDTVFGIHHHSATETVLHSFGQLAPVFVDRKSTRLNSSHGYISYAVFCLKKKKKNK